MLFRLAILQILFLTRLLDAGVLVKQDVALREAFPQATHFSVQAMSPTATQLAQLSKDLGRPPRAMPELFRALDSKSNTLGWAFIDTELGKHLPITYMVAIDKQGTIIALSLLIYREAYGYEVGSKRFRKQFCGKNTKDRLELGVDIDAISGATISSRAVTTGTKKCLWLARNILNVEKNKK